MAHKDIRLALATGHSEGVPLPSAALADELFTKASELGYGHRDVAALFEVLGGLEGVAEDAERVLAHGPRQSALVRIP